MGRKGRILTNRIIDQDGSRQQQSEASGSGISPMASRSLIPPSTMCQTLSISDSILKATVRKNWQRLQCSGHKTFVKPERSSQTDIHHKLHAASSWVGCRCPSALCSPSSPIHVQSHRKTCFLWNGTVVLSSPSSLRSRSWRVERWLDVLSPTVAPAACPESTPMHTVHNAHNTF